MSIFVNVSNHPSSKWSEKQKAAALAMANTIIDVPFPNVPVDATRSDVLTLADLLFYKVMDYYADGVVTMIQGEMTLVYETVRLLKVKDIICVAACSERVVTEVTNADGTTTKNATFKFVQFREY